MDDQGVEVSSVIRVKIAANRQGICSNAMRFRLSGAEVIPFRIRWRCGLSPSLQF
jgi:hypothetical protein